MFVFTLADIMLGAPSKTEAAGTEPNLIYARTMLPKACAVNLYEQKEEM